jgi:hypothetical protein
MKKREGGMAGGRERERIEERTGTVLGNPFEI